MTTEYSIGQVDTCKTKKIILGINACTFISNDIDGINYYGLFTLDKRKNRLTVGPIIGPIWKLNSHFLYAKAESKQIGINGFYLGYQFFPDTKKDKIFDYFIQDQFISQYYKDNGIDNEFPSDSYKSDLLNIGDYIGFGYQLKFLKRFYFTQSIGIGIIYKHLSIDFSNLPDYNDEGYYFSWTTNIGLGYKFDFNK